MAEKKNTETQQSPTPKTKKPPQIEAPALKEPLNRDGDLTPACIAASVGDLAALGAFFDSISDTGQGNSSNYRTPEQQEK